MPTDNQQQVNTNEDNGSEKPFDMEQRTLLFAATARSVVRTSPRTIANQEDGRQLIRSSGSVGANYVEANQAPGKTNAKYRLRIAGKKCKEDASLKSRVRGKPERFFNARKQRSYVTKTVLIGASSDF
ncbi:MAG: four helix bundle protein [Planctomycetes bacterium]|jgi:hypothetical protein|nr:four helix bundle protein [Planctomycetota bacterium]